MSDQRQNEAVIAGKDDAVRVHAFAIGIRSLDINTQQYAALLAAYVESMPKARAYYRYAGGSAEGASIVINDSGGRP